MIEKSLDDKHEEIKLLLPWLVNNTLERSETERVRRHLTQCSACKEDVSLLLSVQSTMAKHSPTPILPAPDSSRLLDPIEYHKRTPANNPAPRRRAAWAASIAAMLAAAALILIYQNQSPAPNHRFNTATATEGVAAMDYLLNIAFAPGSEQAERDQVLRNIGATDISIDTDEGTYRVTINLRVNNLEDLERYTMTLESLPPVQSVDVVAMQLPIRPRK